MNLFNKIAGFFSGDKGIITQAADVVDRFVTTGAEKELAKRELMQIMHTKEIELRQIAAEEKAEFNKRIHDLEGTAKDLIQAGWLGKIVLFARGAQRPVWGFAVLALDFAVFSGQYSLPEGGQMESTFYIINLLVLGFLFGERAVKNVAPLITNYLKSKK